MNTVASLPAKLTDLVRRLRDGDWNMRTPEELAECVADAIMEALATPAVEGGRSAFQMVEEQERNSEARRLATPEQPGSAVQGEVVNGQLAEWLREKLHNLSVDYRHPRLTDDLRMICSCLAPLYTTPPPAPAADPRVEHPGSENGVSLLNNEGCGTMAYVAAPAAEQGKCDLGVGCDEAGVCYALANGHPEQCGRGFQPEARGVEEMVQVPREDVEWLADATNIKHESMPYAMEALGHAKWIAKRALAATPNPVRAEQPDSRSRVRRIAIEKGEPAPRFDEQPEGKGKWKLVPVELDNAMNEAGEREIAFGNDFQDAYRAALTAAPAAPVGVDARHLACALAGAYAAIDMEPPPVPSEVRDALTVVNDAANDARHRGDYPLANQLVHARVTLYRASAAQEQSR